MKALPIAQPSARSPKRLRDDRIMRDYGACVGLLNQLFGLLYDEVCSPCIAGEHDTPEAIARGHATQGRGCCEGSYCDDGLGGPAEIAVRERWRTRFEGRGQSQDLGETACGYLQAGKGCVLGDLKAPRCASQFCWTPELGEKYGVDYDDMRIQESLELILADVIKDWSLGPARPMTREYVEDFKVYLQSMVDRIKQVQETG